VLEERAERLFHPDSYGYRPKRSALDAVAACRRRCWETDWVIDLDIVEGIAVTDRVPRADLGVLRVVPGRLQAGGEPDDPVRADRLVGIGYWRRAVIRIVRYSLVRGLPRLTFNLFPGQWLFRGLWHVGFAWEKVAWRRPGAGSLGPARAGAARLICSAVAC